ncbi:monofunctional biosynthetic peptidoglycan transglycosylase [Aliiroseovarius sp. YM-037]|uniref:monofunctional biosynthetic peptidoglycan transglycosylase n=1 Tax=Aliiroseovarius sp. YM-037 TaxID=3341728 RepID=UPI003A80E459
MARTAKKKPAKKKAAAKKAQKQTGKRPVRWALKWLLRGGLAVVVSGFVLVALYSVINPPTTPYILSESRRLGGVEREWVAIEDISPYMARSVVAAEDANFCLHWGFDMSAIRDAFAAGARRGGSTISQQTVKNAYLWQGRSWTRKAMEAVLTPMVEAVWSKRRIVEVYLNVAEFGEGVFGVDAAARHYFKVGAADLTATQAARLAAILPNPKGRSASRPSPSTRNRAASIRDGAATIRADGRSACFEG